MIAGLLGINVFPIPVTGKKKGLVVYMSAREKPNKIEVETPAKKDDTLDKFPYMFLPNIQLATIPEVKSATRPKWAIKSTSDEIDPKGSLSITAYNCVNAQKTTSRSMANTCIDALSRYEVNILAEKNTVAMTNKSVITRKRAKKKSINDIPVKEGFAFNWDLR